MGSAPSRSSMQTYPGQRANRQRAQQQEHQQHHAYSSMASRPSTARPTSVPAHQSTQSSASSVAARSSTTSSTGQQSTVRISQSGSRVVQGHHVGYSSTNSAAAAASSTSTQTTSRASPGRPGAYAVTRTADGPAQVFRVTVPVGVRPGAEFSVHAGSRRVRVRCPPTSHPGQSLQITLPPEPVTTNVRLHAAPLTAPKGQGGGGAVEMSEEVRQVNDSAPPGGTAQTFLVTIPPNIYPGMQFAVRLEGHRFMVTCPPEAGPNRKVRIVPPALATEPEAAPTTQVFEVVVPTGVQPNQPFTLMANGQRVLVTCPPNVSPGQRIRFQLPVQQVVSNIQLSYEGTSGGWMRTIRVEDLKFQWVRVQKDELVVEENSKFDFYQAAYVRQLQLMEGNDARMRTGTVELKPASEAVVDSKLVVNNTTLLSYADIATVQGRTLDEKTKWFETICQQLTAPWDEGHVKICVRRNQLLNDSVDAVMSLGRDDLRKRWRIEFLGEPGIDAGGVAREWFQLTSEQIFDPDKGLWLSSAQNQSCMKINPASSISCPDDHLIYFRFLGRIIGRAMFDRQLINGHMVRHMYKHLLGWPITFEDLEHEDEEYYQSLKKLVSMEDVSAMCLDFTATEERMGVRTEVELIEGGALKEVNNSNIAQYLEANLKYRMLNRTKAQLTELLLGFFDVIPEPALTVFDYQELELVLCGLPEIDMDDWEENTIYSGMYESTGKKTQVVKWFWDVVRNDFDQETKARLLQFVTGTSGVPSRGFSVLQGNDGNIKKFAIHGVSRSTFPYPRAHTCFNRIDLPNYSSRKDLYDRLKAAVTLSSVGFGIE